MTLSSTDPRIRAMQRPRKPGFIAWKPGSRTLFDMKVRRRLQFSYLGTYNWKIQKTNKGKNQPTSVRGKPRTESGHLPKSGKTSSTIGDVFLTVRTRAATNSTSSFVANRMQSGKIITGEVFSGFWASQFGSPRSANHFPRHEFHYQAFVLVPPNPFSQ